MIIERFGIVSLRQSPGEAAGPAGLDAPGEEVPARRAMRQIVVQAPPVAPDAGDAEPSAEVASTPEPAANFRARQVEHWIAQVAGTDAGGMPFVLLGGDPEPEPPDTELGRLYEEF
jgi:hypothetical protein